MPGYRPRESIYLSEDENKPLKKRRIKADELAARVTSLKRARTRIRNLRKMIAKLTYKQEQIEISKKTHYKEIAILKQSFVELNHSEE